MLVVCSAKCYLYKESINVVDGRKITIGIIRKKYAPILSSTMAEMQNKNDSGQHLVASVLTRLAAPRPGSQLDYSPNTGNMFSNLLHFYLALYCKTFEAFVVSARPELVKRPLVYSSAWFVHTCQQSGAKQFAQ